MKKYAAVLCVILLSACQTPAPIIIEKPVVKGCVKDVPVRPSITSQELSSIQTEEDSSEYVKRLYLDLYTFVGYSEKQEIIIAGCPTIEENKK